MLLGGVSAAHQSAEKTQHVGLLSIKGGNALLPEKLSQALGSKVHLNMPLSEVSKANGVYELLFQNGQKAKADILVLAIPCSVYGDILFEENLIPEEKLISMKNIQYGTIGKILVPFPEPPAQRISFLNDRIAAFFDTECTILTLYYTGETGRFSKDSILDAYLQERPMLEAGFGKLCPPFSTPTFPQDGALVTYEGPVGYSWPNDPFAKGSYSYVAAGQEAVLTATQEVEGETVKSLFAPIDQTLFFAGEHASILMDVGGTMEAACESGERTARMVEKALRSFGNGFEDQNQAKEDEKAR
jgi:monoamine oxidase